MATVPDSKQDHIECSVSDTDLFTPAFVQSDIESGRYEDIYPITKLEGNGPIEFVIDNASDKFLDLNNSFSKVKCKTATLLSPAENPAFKVSFQEVVFCLRKVQLSPHKFQSIQQILEKTPALYPINRVEIKTYSVARGLSSLNWENAILGQTPNRVFIAMTENATFTESYIKNPFLFTHNYLTSIAAYVNVKSTPANPIFLNFEKEDFLDGYRSKFTAFGKINRDEGIGIARNEYKDGFSLFGFDLSPALCVREHQEFKRSGNLRLSLQF